MPGGSSDELQQDIYLLIHLLLCVTPYLQVEWVTLVLAVKCTRGLCYVTVSNPK